MRASKAGIPYHEWEVEKLRANPEFAFEYLRAALESLDNPEERAGSLLMLRALAEAYGGLGAIAASAGLSREALYRSLSPKGNPTLKTLVAVLNAMNLRLTVVPAPAKSKRSAEKPAPAQRGKSRRRAA